MPPGSEVMDVTDTDLLAVLREHPEQGCRYLLEEYTGMVLAVCRKKLGGCCTDEDIEELAGDILFEFYQKREQLSADRGSIRGLLAVMAGRRCIDFYRARRSRTEPQPLDSTEETYADAAESPEEHMLSAERRRTLLAAVAALGEPDKEIIISKYYYGETSAEIADRLSMRTGTVEMRLSRARQKLKAMLGGAEYDH